MLDFTFWDVQHGHACLINTPNNRNIMIDLGIGSFGQNKPFSPIRYLKNNGVTTLDYLIITHPHTDHIDDIENLGLINVSTLQRPKHLSEEDIRGENRPTDKSIVDAYLDLDARYNVDVLSGSASDIQAAEHWGGVQIRTFMTDECHTGNLNNHSIVTVFEYAGSKVLIPGDNEPQSWNLLLKDAGFVAAAKGVDIMLAPHHGRQSAYCSALFDAIGKPRLTIISDGPETDTSATGLYGGQTRGWTVHYPDGTSDERKCVTTRCDGIIRVQVYHRDGTNYLIVNVQKGTATA